MSDPYRDDPNRPIDRPVVVGGNDSGMGSIAGIAIVALLIIGGFLYYNYRGPTTVASTMVPSSTDTISTTPARPLTPALPSAAPSTTPPTAPAQ